MFAFWTKLCKEKRNAAFSQKCLNPFEFFELRWIANRNWILLQFQTCWFVNMQPFKNTLFATCHTWQKHVSICLLRKRKIPWLWSGWLCGNKKKALKLCSYVVEHAKEIQTNFRPTKRLLKKIYNQAAAKQQHVQNTNKQLPAKI